MFKLLILILSILMVAWADEDETEGMRAMRLGCEKQKQGLGCVNYANMLMRKGKEEKADLYFKKACNLKFQDGCDKKLWEEIPVPVIVEKIPEEPTTTTTTTREVVQDGNKIIEQTSVSSDEGINISVKTRMTPEQYAEIEKQNKFKATAILACDQSFKLETPHPFVKSFTSVEKLEKSGDKCIYTQTHPPSGLMTCTFSQAQLKEFEKAMKPDSLHL